MPFFHKEQGNDSSPLSFSCAKSQAVASSHMPKRAKEGNGRDITLTGGGRGRKEDRKWLMVRYHKKRGPGYRRRREEGTPPGLFSLSLSFAAAMRMRNCFRIVAPNERNGRDRWEKKKNLTDFDFLPPIIKECFFALVTTALPIWVSLLAPIHLLPSSVLIWLSSPFSLLHKRGR